MGISWRFPGVVVRGDLGWVKLRTDRRRRVLVYAGRLKAMESFRWPSIGHKRGKGSWVNYVRALRSIYSLGEDYVVGERQWKRLVGKTVKEVAGREWMV